MTAVCVTVLLLALWLAQAAVRSSVPEVAAGGLAGAAVIAGLAVGVWCLCRDPRPHPLASVRKEKN